MKMKIVALVLNPQQTKAGLVKDHPYFLLRDGKNLVRLSANHPAMKAIQPSTKYEIIRSVGAMNHGKAERPAIPAIVGGGSPTPNE